MRATKRKFYNLIAVIVLIAATIFVFFSGVGQAYAASTIYSDVLDDLQIDPDFNKDDYPAVDDDYSLQVIQIAESTDGELFLYVYQPAAQVKQLTATIINMSFSETVDNTALFNLTLLSCAGVLSKYKVDGVRVSSDEVRYYNITSIYRDYDSDIDFGSTDESILTRMSFPVGKLYVVETLDGEVEYSCAEQQTIEIVDPFFGFVEYENGFFLMFDKYCRSHFVAFSTDLPIDNLVEADVYYVSRSFVRSYGGLVGSDDPAFLSSIYSFTYTYGNSSENIVHLNGESEGGNTAKGWLAQQYTWKRIQTVEEFLQEDGLSATVKNALKDKQWVLRFVETTLTVSPAASVLFDNHDYGTDISDVSILRLKYIYQGETYNVGSVSPMGNSDDEADNPGAVKDGLTLLCEWLESKTGVPATVWKILFIVLPIALVLAILSAIFPPVARVVFFVIKYLAIGLWYVLSAPVRLIILIIKKIKGE